VSERVSECVAASQSLTHSLSLTHCQSHSLTHCRSLTDSLRLGLHMAEVEQKGKIRKWTFTGCDRCFANLKPSKFEAGFGRFENFGVVYRLVKSEYMYKNIADETFAEQARPALSLTHCAWLGGTKPNDDDDNERRSLNHSLTHSVSVSQSASVTVSVTVTVL